MIAQSSCKAVRHNGRLVADDLILCRRDYGAFSERLQFSRLTKHDQRRLVGTQSARRPAIDTLARRGKVV